MTELPLLVGVDGSECALTAVDWAVDEAARRGAPLRIVHASLWERYEGVVTSAGPERPTEQEMAEHVVATAAERARLRNPAVGITTDILPREPVDALLGEADEVLAVVTGVRGRGEIRGLLLGSVSLTVAARARCPVVVVRGDRAALAGTHERILLAAGAPETCGDAARFAFEEAEARGCVLDVVRAWRRHGHEGTAGAPPGADTAHRHEQGAAALLDGLLRDPAADRPGVRVHRTALEGPARKVLLDRSAAADLVVIGAHRRHGHFGLQPGRVAHTLLHHALCPVAVVPAR